MDYNNINLRLKRLHVAVKSSHYVDVVSNTYLKHRLYKDLHVIEADFGNDTQEEMLNKILTVVALVATLKDHLARFIGSKKKVENYFSSSLALKLILDINNQEKHAYPLTKRPSRSGFDPIIQDVRQVLGIRGSGSFMMSPDGQIGTTGNAKVVIFANIVDGKGNFIMTLDKLINDSVNTIEDFVRQNPPNATASV